MAKLIAAFVGFYILATVIDAHKVEINMLSDIIDRILILVCISYIVFSIGKRIVYWIKKPKENVL